MKEKKFRAILILLIPQVIHRIAEKEQVDEITASARFYNSKVYEALEQEETKLWHLSPLTLFRMFDEEQKTGSFTFPEEV